MVSGFHGLDVGQAMTPHSSSVLTPRHQIGEVAAHQLLARMEGILMYAPVIDLGYQVLTEDARGDCGRMPLIRSL